MNKARKKEITSEPILWDYFKRKDGTCSVKLKVTSNRTTKYYPVQQFNKNIFLSEEDWAKINERNVRGDLKDIKESINRATLGAMDAIERTTKGNRPFTFDRFEKEYFAQGLIIIPLATSSRATRTRTLQKKYEKGVSS